MILPCCVFVLVRGEGVLPCGRPSARAFFHPSQSRVVYHCGLHEPLRGDWREVSLEEAVVAEVMSG